MHPTGVRRLALALVALVVSSVALADSRIARVTVYVDRAEIVRETKLTLAAGDTEVTLAGIPDGIEADSIRVRAHGTPAALGAVQVREEVREAPESTESAAAEREVRRLMADVAALDGQAAVDAELSAFLSSMKAVTSKATSEKLGEGKVDARSVGDMYAFVRSSLSELKERELDRVEKRRALADQLQLAQATLAAARPPASIRSRVATVDVHADRAGPLTLEIAYVVPGAGWRPVYRATLDPEGTRVELVREAVVAQLTGEDWDDVTLTLSTALPARGVEAPAVTPWIVRVAPQEEPGIAQNLPVPGRYYQGVLGGVAGGVLGDVEADKLSRVASEIATQQQARNAVIEIVETAYDVSFLVPTTTDVPADGREHRVVLQRTSLPVHLSYLVAPRQRAAAFLTATAKLPEGAPLLRGPVRISNGAAYLGTWMMGETAPGAELRLPFGEDARVKVTRVTLPEERSHEGMGDRTRRTVAAFRTRIENLRGNAVQVRVEEAIPVSEDERVKVELAKATTPGSTEDPNRPGVRRWDLALQPGEARELEVGYGMRWPKDVVLASR